MHKQVTKSDLGLNLSGLPEEQRVVLDKMADVFVATVNKALDGTMPVSEAEAQYKELSEKLKGFDAEKFEEVLKDNQTLIEQVKELSENLEKLQKKGIDVNAFTSKLDESLDIMFESEKFKQFVAGTTNDARGFQLKDVTSMTNNYTGTHLITGQDQRPRTQIRDKKLHIRDIATVLEGDPQYTSMSWPVIYDMDRNARYVTENGELPQSSFKMKEEMVSVKRVGHRFDMSKRMLKSRKIVRSFILNKVVEGVLNAEDYGLIFGDGGGDMPKGITAYEGCQPVEKIVTQSIIVGAAGSVKGVTKTAQGALVELAAPNDLLIDGLKITFAAAPEGSPLNGTFDVIKYTDTVLFVEGTFTDAQITAANTGASSITYVVNNGAYKSVESPNSVDALETAIAVMTYAQFAPSVLMLNPITLNSIRTEKATDGNRLKLVEDMNGAPVIGGIRVIPYTGIPAGKYFLGDFKEGATLVDYTGLEIDWAEDVSTKVRNMVVLIAQEEFLFPVYCPWAFAYGTISALKTAIAKTA